MTAIKQAVILAGGLGTRLRPLTLNLPKPMIPICGKPFLVYLLDLLKKNGISEVILLVGYLHEKIEEYFGNGSGYGLSIKYSYSPVEAETGTRIRNARTYLDNKFLLLYGDNYWPFKLDMLIDFYEKTKVLASVVLYSNLDNATKNNTFVNKKGFVEMYDTTRTRKGLNSVDIGFFILQKNIIDLLSPENCSFEKTVLPILIEEKQLGGFLTHDKYYALTDVSRIPKIEAYFKDKNIS